MYLVVQDHITSRIYDSNGADLSLQDELGRRNDIFSLHVSVSPHQHWQLV